LCILSLVSIVVDLAFRSRSGMLSYLDSLRAIQTRVCLSAVLVTATRADPSVDRGLDSLFSYGPSYGSDSTPYPLGFSDAFDLSLYAEGSLCSFGLCISLSLDLTLLVLLLQSQPLLDVAPYRQR
jgi:hypothetical protein